MRKLTLIPGIVLGLAMATTSFAQANTAPASAAPAASTTSMTGAVSNGQYQNQFFNFTLTPPQGWTIASQQDMATLTAAGQKIIATQTKNDPAVKDAMKAAMSAKTYLFQASAKPMGTPENSFIRITALKPPVVPKSSQDVLQQTQYAIQKIAGIKDAKFTMMPAKMLGSQSFAHMVVTLPMGKTSIQENFLATIKNGYVIFILTAQAGNAANPALDQLLSSIKFS